MSIRIAVFFLFVLGLASAIARADEFAVCEEGFLASPREPGAGDCFFDLADRLDRWPEAEERLRELYDRHRDSAPLLFALGRVSLIRGKSEGFELLRRARDGHLELGESAEALRAEVFLLEMLIRAQRWDEVDEELAWARRLPEIGDGAFAEEHLDLLEAWKLHARSQRLGHAYDLLHGLIGVDFPDPFTRYRAAELFGHVAYELRRYGEARAAYQESLEWAAKSGRPWLRPGSLYNLASVDVVEASGPASRGRIARALEDSLRSARELGRDDLVPFILLELGRLAEGRRAREHLESCLEAAPEDAGCLGALAHHLAATEPERARAMMDRALEIARGSGDPWARVYLWHDRFEVSWATRERSAAISEALEMLRFIEELREEQDDDESRAGFFSVWSDAYRWLFGRLLETRTEVTAERDLEIAFDVGERQRARSLLENLEIAGAEGEMPESFAALGAVRSSLGENEAILAYQIASWDDVHGEFLGGSWLLAIHRGGVSVHRLGERAEIERMVKMYVGLVESGGEAPPKPAVRLYRELLGPALEKLPPGIEKLIVLPDGILHDLPFGTLRAESAAPPLARRYRLSMAPSATLWLRWREAGSTPAEVPALVLADPEVPEAGPEAARARAGLSLGPLPRSRREGRAVVRHLGGGSRLLLGAEASEHLLKNEPLRRFGMIHLAAHAVVDDTLPQRSFVLLAPGSEVEDGELTMADIVDLDLEGGVVVLAACSGASGQVLQGEGVMSLARAFFQAGARAVVASLWPLGDEAAAGFFDDFYASLAGGASLAEALQGAQERRIHDPAADWAGLVVLGDGAIVPRPGGVEKSWPIAWLLAPALALLAGLAFLAWRRR